MKHCTILHKNWLIYFHLLVSQLILFVLRFDLMITSLSNSWNQVTLIKLDTSPGSEGPFVVTQEAINPDDTTMTPCSWLLRADGQWISLLQQVLLPREEKERVWFENAKEVMTLLASLPDRPSIIRTDIDPVRHREAVGIIREMSAERLREMAHEWKSHHEE